MEKNLKDYLHLYKGCEVKCTNEQCNEDLEYFGRVTKYSNILFDKYTNGNWKPILRPLSDMTDEEAQDCLATVFLVPPHLMWMDVEALKQFLERNIAFTIGISEDEQGEIPMNMFELTPLTMFNLTIFLLSKHFDLFGLIPSGLAIDKTKLNVPK